VKATTKQRLQEAYDQAQERQLDTDAAVVHIAEYAHVDLQFAYRWIRGRIVKSGPSNPHKRARAAAFAEAKRRNLWHECEKLVNARLPWYRRLFKSRKVDAIGKTYAFNLKRFAKQAYASRPGTREYEERLSLARAQRKSEKLRAKKRFAELNKEASK
jgi:hypothetical protein